MKKGIKIFFISALLIFALSILVCVSGNIFAPESTQEEKDFGKELDKLNVSEDIKKDDTKEIEYITITAEELINDYEANELKADEKYLNKDLIVKGYVSNISKVFESTSVTIGTGEDFAITNISCSFSKENEEQVKELIKGQEIIINGKCEGKGWDIELEKCFIK